jgi:hypothetical protein
VVRGIRQSEWPAFHVLLKLRARALIAIVNFIMAINTWESLSRGVFLNDVKRNDPQTCCFFSATRARSARLHLSRIPGNSCKYPMQECHKRRLSRKVSETKASLAAAETWSMWSLKKPGPSAVRHITLLGWTLEVESIDAVLVRNHNR